MTLAIVHEWVQARAGSEKVFEAMAQLRPDADLFALSVNPAVPLDVGDRRIRTTWLDRELTRERRGLTLPLMPLAWRTLSPRRRYDVVVTSHHAFATQNRLACRPERHFAYVHSPARYIWRPDLDPRGSGWPVRVMSPALRRIDKRRAGELTSVAANSAAIARRIEEEWDVPARILHPPVDTAYFSPGREDTPLELPVEGFILGFGRWIGYKNLDKVIDVGERLARPTVIAGSGPLAGALRERAEQARTPVLVLERPSDTVVRELMRRASVLVFPTVEDFGIVPVEAQAVGTPVVGPAAGGLLETVIDGSTGVLVEDLTTEQLAEAVENAVDLLPDDCRAHAETFSYAAFARGFSDWTGLDVTG